MRPRTRLAAALAMLAVLAAIQLVTAPAALAQEYDCKGYNTLSAFGDGQLFQARSCTEKALSGPNKGRIRGHTKVVCVNPGHCSRIDSDNVGIALWHWIPAGGFWELASIEAYDHNTYGDGSEDYYTPWVCETDQPGVDRWYTSTDGLRATSWSGLQGIEHRHRSYEAELNPC